MNKKILFKKKNTFSNKVSEVIFDQGCHGRVFLYYIFAPLFLKNNCSITCKCCYSPFKKFPNKHFSTLFAAGFI